MRYKYMKSGMCPYCVNSKYQYECINCHKGNKFIASPTKIVRLQGSIENLVNENAENRKDKSK